MFMGGKYMKVQYFKKFFDKSPIAYSCYKVIMDDQGIPYDYEFLIVNKAYENMINLKASDIIGKRYSKVLPYYGKDTIKRHNACQDVVMNNKTVQFDMQFCLKWLRVMVFPLGKNILACIFNNVTKEYMQDQQIEGFLRVNLDMLCVADTDGKFLKVNEKFEDVLGYKVEELEGKSFISLIHKDDIPSTLEAIKSLEEQKGVSGFINRYLCKDGSYKYLEWYSQPNGKYIYASLRDVTEKKIMEAKLNHTNIALIKLTEKLQKKNEALETLSVTDKLTGLYNRHFLDKRIKEKMEHSDQFNQPLTMIVMDLDCFKLVNDKWGHPVGDEVLKQTALITSSIIGKSNILVRMGGEEFVILLPQIRINDALILAEKLRETLDNKSYPIVGKITASFGVAERMKSESFFSWYQRADQALYQAKKDGRNRVVNSDTQESLPVTIVHLEGEK